MLQNHLSFSGPSKPPVCFLNDFVCELKELMSNGMTVNGTQICVKLHSFVCNAPARAFIKCTKLHSGYSSCERCDQHGEWCGKVIFSSTACTARTDHSFRNQTDDGHHLPGVTSPLTALDIDMIRHFPLDPMHLLHLGVMRRLLLLWLRGPLTVRLPSRVVSDISSSLLSLCSHIPTEFCRRPRALTEIDRWKATEFRLFLLYCGPAVLKGRLPDLQYKHFLLLFVASTILSRKTLRGELTEYAGGLLTAFVQGVHDIYGKTQLVYNVHCLLHVVDDVTLYGCLDSYSSYPFENKLKNIKKLVHKPSLPLQQVVLRLAERDRCVADSTGKTAQAERIRFQQEHHNGQVPDCFSCVKQFSKLSFDPFQLSVSQRDSCVQLLDKSAMIIRNVLQQETTNTTIIVYNKFRHVSDVFDYHLQSSSLDIFEVSDLDKANSFVVNV